MEKPMWKKILNIIIYILVGGVIAFAFFGVVGLQAQVTALEQAAAEQAENDSEHRRRTAQSVENYPWLQAQVKALESENEELREDIATLRSELAYQRIIMSAQHDSTSVDIQKNADAIRDLQ